MANLVLKGKIVEKFGSQVAFSRKLKVHDSLVSKVVRGWRGLSEKEQSRWAGLLGTDAKEIFGE
ncbi:hypothetical protein TRIP_B170093 [uncultured Desulfatiglans sp.]|uniref:HTH cro/C1-type domain-containing protein n=1 Tax=Uncultured Desulfatiglans sp. TaxID=1748965 RepID=A0A653A170_UNCDX|nr:hypothetical protein TRIP_B170093 [uncultured Desulfatiglans sp.]